MNEIEQQIANYLAATLACSAEQAFAFENLYKQGLDSFSFVELISYLENKYDIHFADDELMSGSFGNIAGIAALITSKRV